VILRKRGPLPEQRILAIIETESPQCSAAAVASSSEPILRGGLLGRAALGGDSMVGAAATFAGVGMFVALRGCAGSCLAETGVGFGGVTCEMRCSFGAGIGGATRGATSALNKSN
jgi:hypothetical protein